MRNQKNNVEQVSRLSNSNVAQASSLLFNVAQASSLFKTHRQDACSTLIKTVAIFVISAICTVRSFAQTEEEVKVFKGVFENQLKASEMVIKTLLKKMHHYPNHKLAINDIIAIYGLLRFADSTNNQKAIKDAETLYAGYLDGSWHISKGHLELDFLSIISAEFFRLTGNKKYLECLVPTAEDIIRNPKKDGLYRLSRMWPEDMLFIGSSLASVWQVTGDKRFIDFAANNMILYLKTLQKNNGSIEYHSFIDSATVGKKEVSPMGNALALVALSDVLCVLPKNHKTYKNLLDGYTKLASYIVNNSEATDTMSTSFFVYGIATGLRNKLINGSNFTLYLSAKRKIIIASVNKIGEIRGAVPFVSSQIPYRTTPGISIPGQGAFLLATGALIDFDNKKEDSLPLVQTISLPKVDMKKEIVFESKLKLITENSNNLKSITLDMKAFPKEKLRVEDMEKIADIFSNKNAIKGAEFLNKYICTLQLDNGFYKQSLNSDNTAWSLGSGKALAAIAKILKELPVDAQIRFWLISSYKKSLYAIERTQDNNGLWHLIPDNFNTKIDIEASSDFLYAIATGLENKWLTRNVYREILSRGSKAISKNNSSSTKKARTAIASYQKSAAASEPEDLSAALGPLHQINTWTYSEKVGTKIVKHISLKGRLDLLNAESHCYSVAKTAAETIKDMGKLSPAFLNKKYPAGGISVWIKDLPNLRTVTDDLGFWHISIPYAVLEKDYGKSPIIMMQEPGQKAIDSSKFKGLDRSKLKNLLTSPYTETHDDLPAGPADYIDGYKFTGTVLKKIREDRKYLHSLLGSKQQITVLKDGKELLSVYLKGNVINKQGQDIEEASVWLKRSPSFLHRSNAKGEFEILSKDVVLYLHECNSLMVTAPGYTPKEVSISSYLLDNIKIQLEPLSQPKVVCETSLPMIKIPAGFFRMGKGLRHEKRLARVYKTFNDYGIHDCWPIQTVSMPSFYFSQTQLDAHMILEMFNWARNNGYTCDLLNYFSFPLLCNALSERDGLTPCYTTDDGKIIRNTAELRNSMICHWNANGYRLPTYAEHEYACYAGRTGNYYWGNDGSQFYDYHWLQFVDMDEDDEETSINFRPTGEKVKAIRIKYPEGSSNILPKGRQSALDWRIYDSASSGFNTAEPLWDLRFWRADDSYAPRGPSVVESHYIIKQITGIRGFIARTQISIQDSHDGQEALDWPKLDKPLAFGFYGYHAISGAYFNQLMYPMPTRLARSAGDLCKDISLLKINKKPVKKLSPPVAKETIGKEIDMAHIPAGEFNMGRLEYSQQSIKEFNLASFYSNNERKVNIAAFQIGKFEVTLTQWKDVYNWAIKNGYKDLPKGDKGDASSDDLNHPVCNINWFDSIKWCNAASEMKGLKPVYYLDANFTQIYKTGETEELTVNWNENGYRLPTEAEWEKAAQGGSDDCWFWGAGYLLIDYGWVATKSTGLERTLFYGGRYRNGTRASNGNSHPVGEKIGNQFGLYDVLGNVHEWCWDLTAPYDITKTDNPLGPLNHKEAQMLIKKYKRKRNLNKNRFNERALRGHCYNSIIHYKATYGHNGRSGAKPATRKKIIGFRVVKNND